jgi:hypothetical protein
MPDSMFDKLGDLLSEAIESGNFFKENQKENKETADNSVEGLTRQENADNSSYTREPDLKTTEQAGLENNTDSIKKYTKQRKKHTNSQNKGYSVYKSIQLNNKNQFSIVSSVEKVIKYAHPELKKACTTVEVFEGMTYGEAKKQYHKKLLRYHPDRNSDNEIMKKITKNKTDELVKAWAVIEAWFKEN